MFYFQALCPVKPTFKVLLLREYRGISLSAPSLPKSPRKSAKEYTETVEDLVAPFDHYLDESILEEDFMIEGNIEFTLNQWFLNWGNLPSEGKLPFLGG